MGKFGQVIIMEAGNLMASVKKKDGDPIFTIPFISPVKA
jgi:hypothetical protein